MIKKVSNKTVLKINKDDLKYLKILTEIFVDHDYSSLNVPVFSYSIKRVLPSTIVEKFETLTGKDLYRGWLWEISEPPSKYGFCFHQESSLNLYVSNIPYYRCIYSNSGYSWNYEHTNAFADLTLNLATFIYEQYFLQFPQFNLYIPKIVKNNYNQIKHLIYLKIKSHSLKKSFNLSYNMLVEPILYILSSNH